MEGELACPSNAAGLCISAGLCCFQGMGDIRLGSVLSCFLGGCYADGGCLPQLKEWEAEQLASREALNNRGMSIPCIGPYCTGKGARSQGKQKQWKRKQSQEHVKQDLAFLGKFEK